MPIKITQASIKFQIHVVRVKAQGKNQALMKIARASCKKKAANTTIVRSLPSTQDLRFTATKHAESIPAASIMIQRSISTGITSRN